MDNNVTSPEHLDLFTSIRIGDVFTAIIALFGFLAILNLRTQQKSSILMQCSDRYSKIKEIELAAIRSNDTGLAKLYYEQMIHLFWTEFQIWRGRHIENNIMRAWAEMRYNLAKTNSTLLGIKYPEVWKNVQTDFGKNSSFVNFTELIHNNKIEEAITKYKTGFWASFFKNLSIR